MVRRYHRASPYNVDTGPLVAYRMRTACRYLTALPCAISCEKAIRELDDTEFKNPWDSSNIRVVAAGGGESPCFLPC
jgi:hypothetical protein